MIYGSGLCYIYIFFLFFSLGCTLNKPLFIADIGMHYTSGGKAVLKKMEKIIRELCLIGCIYFYHFPVVKPPFTGALLIRPSLSRDRTALLTEPSVQSQLSYAVIASFFVS